jgi:hypothetical protein
MKRSLVVLVVVALPLVAAQLPASGLPPGVPHLPDLVTRAPFDVRLVVTGGDSVRKLFFGNTIGNVGDGPLELRAENDVATGTTDAIQEIYTHTESSTSLQLLSSSLVGVFVFHPAHDHWHMKDFARYELRRINADGSTGRVLAITDKVSFCMIDSTVLDSTIPHFGMGLSHSCGQNSRQGVKVGWGDTYVSILPDQFIDITTLPDGTYRLVSVADPNTGVRPGGRLIEKNDSNNAASVDVVITRTQVTIVPGSERTGIDAPNSRSHRARGRGGIGGPPPTISV